jgi:hypothetical protein
MRSIFFLLFALGLCLAGFGQKKGKVKLYGFKQVVASGKAPGFDSTTGLRISKESGRNYYLYAVAPSRIYPTEMWIDGNHYGVTIKTIEKTPVEIKDEIVVRAPKMVLVPKTTEKVVQLIPTAAIQSKAASKLAKSLAQTNAIVVVYKQNGKFYYQTLPKLETLTSAAQ